MSKIKRVWYYEFMNNSFEKPFVGDGQSEEKIEEGRKLYEKNVKEEKKYANEIGDTFVYEGVHEGIQKAKTALTEKEIIEDDAHRLDQLKNKEKTGSLTDTEKKELKFRENSDLFMSEYEARDNSFSAVSSASREGFLKEAFYPYYIIDGITDGKKVKLSKTVYPDFSQKQLTEESAKNDPFYMAKWKGPVKYEYKGLVDGLEISGEEAEELFEKYSPFAKRRTEEIKELKADKEINEYGHEIKGSEADRLRRVENKDELQF